MAAAFLRRAQIFLTLSVSFVTALCTKILVKCVATYCHDCITHSCRRSVDQSTVFSSCVSASSMKRKTKNTNLVCILSLPCQSSCSRPIVALVGQLCGVRVEMFQPTASCSRELGPAAGDLAALCHVWGPHLWCVVLRLPQDGAGAMIPGIEEHEVIKLAVVGCVCFGLVILHTEVVDCT